MRSVSVARLRELLRRVVTGQKLEEVTVRVSEVDAAPIVPVVDLHVAGRKGPAPVSVEG